MFEVNNYYKKKKYHYLKKKEYNDRQKKSLHVKYLKNFLDFIFTRKSHWIQLLIYIFAVSFDKE